MPDGSIRPPRKKLFEIPYLYGVISYFGLAVVFPRRQQEYLSSWLPNFIRHHSGAHSLQSFAESLRVELNQIVPPPLLRTRASGFHICGYDDRGFPDFWFLSNIGGRREGQYVDFQPQYAPPTNAFLGRDAGNEFGWDGTDPLSARNGAWVYRNGDFRAHHAAWELLDEIFRRVFRFADFRPPRNPKQYGEYVKFKLEFIAKVYDKYATKKIIGKPIDVLVFHNP
jgi:hypothetical protein